jgi:streptogramin lyase
MIVVLSACSGGGGGSSVPSVSRSGALQAVTVRIDVPASTSSSARRAAYVSPATLGATITAYGTLQTPPSTPTGVYDLSSGSGQCSAGSGGSRTCTLTVQAPAGNDYFLVKLYNEAPVSGAIPGGALLLSSNTVTLVVVLGQSNVLPVTLNGSPATIVLSPQGFLLPPGQSNSFTFFVNALDTSGNLIIGPGNYTNPIALAVSGDSHNTLSLSTNSITAPGTTSVTVTYNNGGAFTGTLNGVPTATITGSTSGATSGSLTVQVNSGVTTVTVTVPGEPTSNSQSGNVYQAGGYWTIPIVAGYSGSIQYASNNAPANTTTAFIASTVAPGTLPGTQPTGTPLLYVSYSLNNTTAFTQDLESINVTLPSSVTTTGENFYESVYDTTAGTNLTPSSGTTYAGTGSQTVSFGLGIVTSNPTAVTLTSAHTYVIVISSASSAAPAGTITEYPSGQSGLTFITAGPDGNLWFGASGAIAKITTAGAITTYGGASSPDGITAGPDGNLWFTDVVGGYGRVAKITTAGAVTDYGNSSIPASEGQITTGPDGNLWFIDTGDDSIGKVTTAGTITEYGGTLTALSGLTAGPDGNLWFTQATGSGKIGKITTAGTITLYGGALSSPYEIVTGADGNLWFTEVGNGKIGKITTAGTITEYGGSLSAPIGITSGPDGNLWFVEYGNNKIGKIVP